MKVLIIHNHYLQPGGEDEVVGAEKQMLERFGHEVVLYERSNAEINKFTLPQKLRFISREAPWSIKSYQEIQVLIRKENPDIAHFHNSFLCVSPSAYEACYDLDIPVVQTLHNYRILCPIGIFYRNNHKCEDCLNRGKISAVINRCWRNSYFYSWVLVNVIRNMEKRKIFSEKISHFIALSEFSRRKFLDNGFVSEEISVKPNFLETDPGISKNEGSYALFIGSLRSYKGISTLVRAWKYVKDFSLKIIGDGPLRAEIKSRHTGKRIELLGQKSLSETLEYIKKALFVIIPSECYETFSRVAMEAFACGVPVIASNTGALADIVDEGKTGLLFNTGDANDLVEKIHYFIKNPLRVKEMGRNARQKYEEKYTSQQNYKKLMSIYKKAIQQAI